MTVSQSVAAARRMPASRRWIGGTLGVLLLATAAACSNDDAPTTTSATASATTSPGAVDIPTDATVDAPAETTPGTADPTTAPTGSAPPGPEETYDFTAVSEVVADFVDAQGLNGAGLIVVEKNDGVVHEEYWGEFEADRVSLIASSSKMIVAGVLMRLDDAGLLDIDAPVADIADWGSGNPEITPAQLLSNSSGLVGLGPNPAYLPYVCQFLPTGDLQTCASSIFTTDADDDDVIAPDTEFRYGGAQWQIAGAAAEIASGKPWDQLIEETYIEPCGVESLAFNNHWTQLGSIGFVYPEEFNSDPNTLEPTDNPNMEGGAYITAPDYATLLLMHLRDGRCGEEQVLAPGSVDRLHADRIGDVYGASASGQGYGMGWWINRDTGRLRDAGAFGSVPWLDLDGEYGAYLVIEADGATGEALADQLYGPVDDAVLAAQ